MLFCCLQMFVSFLPSCLTCFLSLPYISFLPFIAQISLFRPTRPRQIVSRLCLSVLA